jgi:hypothetical protein
MIKMSLMVEATAPTYGLSIWATSDSGKPTLRWAEGLEETEIAIGETAVAEIFSSKGRPQPATEGDQAICFCWRFAVSCTRRRCALWPLCSTTHSATGEGTQRAQRRRTPGAFTPVVPNPSLARGPSRQLSLQRARCREWFLVVGRWRTWRGTSSVSKTPIPRSS